MLFLFSTSTVPVCPYQKQIVFYKIVEESDSVSNESIVKWIPPIVVILIFIIGQVIANRNNRRELEKTWYIKAYLDDSIRKLHEFYKEADEIMLASIKKHEATSPDDLISVKTASNETMSDLIRTLEFDVIETLRLSYKDIFDSVGNELLEIRDVVAESFDHDDTDESYNYWLKKSRYIKSRITETLSRPIRKSKIT